MDGARRGDITVAPPELYIIADDPFAVFIDEVTVVFGVVDHLVAQAANSSLLVLVPFLRLAAGVHAGCRRWG